MDWKQEAFKRLDVLAEKLGVTAVYLWTVLVRQAISDGIADVIWALFFFATIPVTYIFIKKCNNLAKKDHDWAMGSVILTIVTAILFAVGINESIEAIQHFYNPGYYALREVLNTVGR